MVRALLRRAINHLNAEPSPLLVTACTAKHAVSLLLIEFGADYAALLEGRSYSPLFIHEAQLSPWPRPPTRSLAAQFLVKIFLYVVRTEIWCPNWGKKKIAAIAVHAAFRSPVSFCRD